MIALPHDLTHASSGSSSWNQDILDHDIMDLDKYFYVMDQDQDVQTSRFPEGPIDSLPESLRTSRNNGTEGFKGGPQFGPNVPDDKNSSFDRRSHIPPFGTCHDLQLNPFLPTVAFSQHLLSERLTSLCIMGEPRVPPLNPSETIVLSEHYRL